MSEKRKISYEQDKALEHGRQVARSNQRRRVAAREAADKAAKERADFLAACGVTRPHGWKNWEYADDYKTETRVCRDCGATETRAVRL